MPDDSQLLQAYVNERSQTAFAELVGRHLALVYRSALRQLSGDAHRAQDVSQMVFTALAQKAGSLTGHSNLVGWLYLTTHHSVCRIVREEGRRKEREQETWHMHATQEGDAFETDRSQVTAALDQALRELKPTDREAILLRFFSNQSFAEVGKGLQLREDAARIKVARALEKLRHRLTGRGITTTAASLATTLAQDALLGAPAGTLPLVLAATAHITPAAFSVGTTIASSMTIWKTTTAVVLAAAIVASSVMIHQRHAAQHAKAELETVRHEAALVRERVREAETRLSRASQVRPAPRVVAAPPSFDDIAEAERARGDRFLAAHPEIRALLSDALRARISGKYLPLYREFKLSPEQIETFEQLMVSASGRVVPAVGTLWLGETILPDERNRRIRALFGDEFFKRWESSRASTLEPAQQAAQLLASTGEPLRPEQADQLTTLFGSTDPRAADKWSAALPKLTAILSASQIEGIASLYLDEQYRRAESAALSAASKTP